MTEANPPPCQHVNAAGICVSSFRTVLFWPLTLNPPTDDGAAPPDMDLLLKSQIAALVAMGSWEEVPDLLDHIAPRQEPPASRSRDVADSYAEFTYFHEFVQQFLFAKTSDCNRASAPLRLFRRTDITMADVVFSRDSGQSARLYRLQVERLNLYVTHLGIAILALELHMPADATARVVDLPKTPAAALYAIAAEAHCLDGLPTRAPTLADVQQFNDGVRRAHAPFLVSGDVPFSVIWHGKTLSTHRVDDAATGPVNIAQGLRAAPPGKRGIPPFTHFSSLIGNAATGKGWFIRPLGSSEPSWRHAADDRLPILSTITLPHRGIYDLISDGDWMRTCFVDPPGGDRYPYARAFVEEEWKKHVYDRFHYGPGESTEAPTRFLIAGYGFIAVGSGWFFNNHIQMHMRRHYFQLMLLAQIERASMLAVSSRITLAVNDYEGRRGTQRLLAERRLEAALQQVEHDFLQFVHRFRFTGVSEQVQPTELFDKLRERMRLPSLYADIKDELTTAIGFLALRSDQRQAGHAGRLSVVATFGVILGLAFALLSTNVISLEQVTELLPIDKPWKGWRAVLAGGGTLLLTIALFCFGGLRLAAALRDSRIDAEEPVAIRLRQILRGMGWIGGLAGLGLLVGGLFAAPGMPLAVIAAVGMVLWLLPSPRQRRG